MIYIILIALQYNRISEELDMCRFLANLHKFFDEFMLFYCILLVQGSRNHGGKGGTGPPNILTGGSCPVILNLGTC